jgi:hypothetical protein
MFDVLVAVTPFPFWLTMLVFVLFVIRAHPRSGRPATKRTPPLRKPEATCESN